MNERIKELVVESRNGLMRDGKLYPHIGIRFEEDWQRFAELIVRECVKVSLKSSHRNDDMGAIIARQIHKHFGVQE